MSDFKFKTEQELYDYHIIANSHGQTVGELWDAMQEIDRLKAEIQRLKSHGSKELVVKLIRGAASHLSDVMVQHPYCDHPQVVRHYADIWLENVKGELK